jgi:DNA-binding NarL/FixJ family response regulator
MSTHAPARAPDAAPANSFTVPERQRLRVVVADDTPHMLDLMTAVIEDQGRAEVVATATNGIGAIRAALRFVPDVVFLDVCMPLMNGFEAAVHIKRRLPGTKVLLVSADEDPELAPAALDCGADGFLWKGSFARHCHAQLLLTFLDAR